VKFDLPNGSLANALYRRGLEDAYFDDFYDKYAYQTVHYPTPRMEPGLKVALITNNTSSGDRYDWVRAGDTYTDIGSWGDVVKVLNQGRFGPNSISCLIFSGHGVEDHCGVLVEDGSLNEDNITPAAIRLIKAKVKPGGDIVIASCNSGSNPRAVKTLVNKIDRDVSTTTGDCETIHWWAGPHGGYADEGWIRYRHNAPAWWP
jgi:hypothetical protein